MSAAVAEALPLAGPSRDDLALLARFEDGSLERDAFSHAAHLRVAWTMLAVAPLPEALARYSVALRRLATGFGVPQLYSETITVFYMVVVHERRHATPGLGFEAFRSANPDLFGPMRAFVGPCYPAGTFDGAAHKQAFRLPLRWPAC